MQVDREREHEAVIVIRVITDQVDAARRRPDTLGVASRSLAERVTDTVQLSAEPIAFPRHRHEPSLDLAWIMSLRITT
jgi:hypothetical protein